MKRRPTISYTETQKALMWERWKQGESLHQIAQLLDRNHSSIQRILAQTGGIRQAPRRRSSLALSLAEREEISRSLATGHSTLSIAGLLKRDYSQVQLNAVARQLNERPRKTLDYKTPAERFSQLVASTG